MATKKYGIDVSHHQGTIDWNKVKNDKNVEFVILRAGYGKVASQIDNQFETNYAKCRELGIPIGAYWYSYAETAEDAKLEATAANTVLKNKIFEYPIFYDVEENGQMSKDVMSTIIPTFGKAMQKKGWYVGVYSYAAAFSYIDESITKDYDVWVAHTGVDTPSYANYSIWQNSWTGTVNGISGNVDTDICVVDYPSIINKAGKNNYKTEEAASTESTSKTESTTKTESTSIYTAGEQVALKSAKLYESAEATKSSGTKSGTFYIYEATVTNGRIRITNTKSNVGKTPAGSYVTGWVETSAIDSTTDNASTKKTTWAAGDKVTLKSTSLYAASTALSAKSKKTGTYYIYDGVVTNNRLRITNNANYVGKSPMSTYVSGWVDVNDI